MLHNIHNVVSVNYKTSILNPDGTVAKENPWTHNLVLDSGMDMLGTSKWGDVFVRAVVGTGTTPTNRDSATTTFSRSGTTVTASGNFFEAADVGRLLKFDTGEEMYITVYTSVTEVTVDTSGTLAASEGTVWYVNETGHGTETKRTATYGSNGGDNATSISTGTVTMQRTYIFSEEVGAVTYTEIGWAPASTGNLFGRDLISGGGDSLVAGQQYKVVVQVNFDPSPDGAAAVTDVGNNGFNTAGTATYHFAGGWGIVLSSGSTSGTLFSAPSGMASLNVGVHTTTYSLPSGVSLSNSINTDVDFTPTRILGTYTSGNFYRDVDLKLGVSQANYASIYGFSFGVNGFGYFFSQKFTTAQTKDSDHTLTLTLRQSWDRNLTN